MAYNLLPIEIQAGVEPATDNTVTTTKHYTFSKGIRFVGALPEKVGGWASVEFDNLKTISGKVRSIFSYKLNGYTRYLLGTNTNLYDIFGTVLTNITPFNTTPIAVADSLDTYYATLGNNPIATIDGSTTLTITDTAHKFQAGDTVTLSGASTTNGVPDTEINAAHFIRSISINSYTVIIETPATSTGNGGGNSVVRASGYITVNSTAHGLSDGARVKIQDAATTGGITDAQINLEFIIRNTTTNAFDVYTAGTATSSVTGGGGTSTAYLAPIASGSADTLQGTGYGAGLYGIGLYGVSKTSSSTTPARLWSHDRFGDLTISCFNNQSDIYSWDGSTLVAPAKVTNSPKANYVFVSNEIVVALGYDTGAASAKENGISWSDQGGLTNWTTGQSGSDAIEGAGKFISHVKAGGGNLLFTENQTYTFRYIGGQFIWQTSLLDSGIGIISQNARASASGNVFWMSNNNFHMWRGGNAEIVPSNSGTESTVLRYVFDNINFSQKEKIFCWYNEQFREVSWHYPSEDSNEPDRIVKVNIDTFVWVIDEIDRTAAEYPSVLTQNPLMASPQSVVYFHEIGNNDDESGLEWQLTTPYYFGGQDTIELEALIPDCALTGDINVNIKTKDYPSSSNRYNKNYVITNETERLPVELNGRYWQIDLTGNDLDQELMLGQWYAEVKKGSPR
jgi:hypothetical protein